MERIHKYQEVNKYRLSLEASWENFRFVCVDTESTGLDARKDKLVSLAGVGLYQGEICLWDQISIVMPVAYNTSSVTVHGITRETASSGMEEPEALARFLEWLSDGVIVGHHIGHDLSMLNLACQEHFQLSVSNVAVDTLEALTMVHEAGGFPGLEIPGNGSLDSLLEVFRIVPHDRHTASGDAFLTAQVMLRILKEAGKLDLWNLEDLHAWYGEEPFPFGKGKLP